MLARLQKLLLFGLLTTLVGWTWLAVEYLSPGWLIAGLLTPPAVHAGVLSLEFVLMYRANRLEPTHPLRVRDAASAWCAETWISAWVFYWLQPFRPQAIGDQLGSSQGRRAVVLIHGLVCNRGFWNPWMRRLRSLGIPCIAINLEPIFGTIDDGVEAIDAAVRQATQATGLAPVIVTHSMGGLSVRAWLRARSADDRVHRIITIAAPHHGTALAKLATSDVARRMRIGSPWLTELAGTEPPSRYCQFTCFYGHCDNIVFPTCHATLPGADNRHVPASGHIQMAHRAEVFREVMRWLR
ncbi:MAG: permease [Burkholderiales bacterium PBB1]|nr:MAG: permease [Burkholderiales bacterium PBB1]